jgi:hypothetical protein
MILLGSSEERQQRLARRLWTSNVRTTDVPQSDKVSELPNRL